MVVSKISPITTLYVLRGVSLNPSYTDSQTYASREAQTSYFQSKTKYSYTNLVPVRDNVVKLPIAVDALFDCGYCMFKNANFNDKWFYAFIVERKWVNANCTEITLQIDVITTWMFDWTLCPSYVVRKHVNDDDWGKYTEPEEGINTALKINVTRDKTDYSKDQSDVGAVIWYMPMDGKIPGTADDKYESGGIFCACNRVYYPRSDWGRMYEEIIQPLADDGLLDNIIAIQIVPSKFKEMTGSNWGTFGFGDSFYQQGTIQRSSFSMLDGYTPFNKKLLTFPYNSFVVASSDGVQQEYCLENFSYSEGNDNIYYNVYCTLSINPVMILQPINYGKTHTPSAGSVVSYPIPSYFSTIKNFPLGFYSGLSGLGYAQNIAVSTIDYTRDFYKEEHEVFMKRKTSPNWSKKLDATLTGGLDAILWGMSHGSSPIMSFKAEGTRTGGTLPSSTTLFNLCFANFFFEQRTITHQEAERADKMLTRWGYSINNVSDVNITGREIFNYIETNDLLIRGNIPAEDIAQIIQIFDNGITFWHTERGHEIGTWNGAANSNPIV